MEKQAIFFIGVVVVILILVIDGIRRMRNASPRYQQRQYEKNKVEIDERSSSELPNGGSRKVKKGDEDILLPHMKDIAELEQDLDKRVPVLMDSVENNIEQNDASISEARDSERQTNLDLQVQKIDEDDVLLQTTDFSHSSDVEEINNEALYSQKADSTFSAIEEYVDFEGPIVIAEENTDQSLDIETKKSSDQDVLVLNITSNGDAFQGLELYHAMIASGLRFGDMNIFHSSNQQGQIQFSLVNSVQPGTFDLESISQFSTPGVSMFMQLPCEVDAITAFEQMKNVAHFLAKELNAQVRDDSQTRLTEQTTEHYRDRIRQFQRTQLLEQA